MNQPHANLCHLRVAQISYGYFEKDEVQRDNFEFFIKAGIQPSPTRQHIHWVVVSSTDKCSPCRFLVEAPG